MIDNILNFLKKIIPKQVFQSLQPAYHFLLGYLAAVWYGRPSDKMIVVGVTGTTGKTTTVFLLANVLKEAGLKTGHITTAMFSDGEKDWLNDKKMTMLGRFFTQKLLRQMVNNKCNVAVVETTSQGITQFRHRFIDYDILVFTGLYPEHIEAHDGFENYKKTKGKLFARLKNCQKKNLGGKEIAKTIIANTDDKHADYFLNFWAESKLKFGVKNNSAEVRAENINFNENGLQFSVNGTQFNTNLLGEFNVMNSLAAISVAKTLGVPLQKIKEGLEKTKKIPGRLEKIDASTSLGTSFTVIVDYSFEPNAVAKLYETVNAMPHNKIIHVLGSTGGGRDKARRPKLGKLAGINADFVIVTNEDPYDEDPMEIINEVTSGITRCHPERSGAESKDLKNNNEIPRQTRNDIFCKTENVNFWRILNRREAIKKALALAGQNDIVLVTGKGSEQAICVADGKKVPWDDRKAILKELSSRT